MIIADIIQNLFQLLVCQKGTFMLFITNKKKVPIIDDNPSLQRLPHVRLKM